MLLRENPQPIPARQPRPSSANAAREEEQQQAWELLAQEAMDEDAYLKELAGVDDLACASSLQVVVNTSTSTVSHLGSKLPNLYELSLNNSVLDCLRDLGTGFTQLRVLWVSRCGLTSLDGASGFPALRELYAAFNDVADLQALDVCAELEVLDLEGNCVTDPGTVSSLAPLTNLLALTLAGNPISQSPSYRHQICTSLPSLTTLDDVEVSTADHVNEQGCANEGPGSKQGAAYAAGGSAGMEGGINPGQQKHRTGGGSLQRQQQQQQQQEVASNSSLEGAKGLRDRSGAHDQHTHGAYPTSTGASGRLDGEEIGCEGTGQGHVIVGGKLGEESESATGDDAAGGQGAEGGGEQQVLMTETGGDGQAEGEALPGVSGGGGSKKAAKKARKKGGKR